MEKVKVQHSLLHWFVCNFSSQVLFNHQAGDRGSISCPESRIFNVNSNGNFRMISGCKGNKYSMIIAMGILSCPSLATYGYTVQCGTRAVAPAPPFTAAAIPLMIDSKLTESILILCLTVKRGSIL